MASVKCKSCKESISPTAKFCPHCGVSNAKAYCRACGLEIGINDVACPECGTPTKEIATPVIDHTKGDKYELALAGFIAAFMVPLAGLILGIIALNANKGLKNNSKTFGILAVIISTSNIILSIIVAIIYVLALFASVL